MSVNCYQPHVLVLAEDDANRQIANGFLLDPCLRPRNIQVLSPSGGWSKVHRDVHADHIEGLRKYKDRHLVLLVDFDGNVEERAAYFRDSFPEDIRDRVYLLGASSEPEPLRRACRNSLEEVGKILARECFQDESELWGHPLLMHNEIERKRLQANVKSILF
jgi:hypothetical protein